MKTYCLYKHTSPSGKVYIGQTCHNPKQRWGNGKKYETSPLFYRAIQKYGWENFKHEILFTGLTKDVVDKLEIAYISYFKEKGMSYNILKGGGLGNTGMHFTRSQETREKMSQSLKGRPAWNKGLPGTRKGCVLSEETKQKIRVSHKGGARKGVHKGWKWQLGDDGKRHWIE